MPVLDAAINGIAGQIAELAAEIKQLKRNQVSAFKRPEHGHRRRLDRVQRRDRRTCRGHRPAERRHVSPPSRWAPSCRPRHRARPWSPRDIQGLYVAWDGLMNDGSVPQADFAALQVHVSASQNFIPSAATLTGHMWGPGCSASGV